MAVFLWSLTVALIVYTLPSKGALITKPEQRSSNYA